MSGALDNFLALIGIGFFFGGGGGGGGELGEGGPGPRDWVAALEWRHWAMRRSMMKEVSDPLV